MKVLIVDPDWRFARQASQFLESHAHLVVHQSQAARALEQAARWQPDLVILAAEFAEQGLLEPITSLPGRPAVLLTESMDRYDRAWRAWQQGGDELLMKPVFCSDEIRQAVSTALENAASGTRHSSHSTSASA